MKTALNPGDEGNDFPPPPLRLSEVTWQPTAAAAADQVRQAGGIHQQQRRQRQQWLAGLPQPATVAAVVVESRQPRTRLPTPV